jgi:hypothetical protein
MYRSREGFSFFLANSHNREGSYIGGWFAAAAIGTERLSVLEDLREVWGKQTTMEEQFLTPYFAWLALPSRSNAPTRFEGCR